jgi:hypothetical protein
MFKVVIALAFIVFTGFSGYGVAKAINLNLSDWWCAGLTIFAVFLFGFAEGLN